MNLGIGDAYNLGWKLALVAKGQARETLLDSYEAERVTVAKAVLRNSDRGFEFEVTDNPAIRWLRANLVIRLVGPLTRLPAVRSLVFRLFSQTWIGYRGSPAVASPSAMGKWPRPGDRAPYGIFEALRDGRTGLYDILKGTGHHLLLFEGLEPSPALDAYQLAVDEVLGRYAVDTSVHVIPAKERRLHEIYGVKDKARLFLMRPDGHVAFVSSLGELDDLAMHMKALFRRRVAHEGHTRSSIDHLG
jgi:FAD binding domain